MQRPGCSQRERDEADDSLGEGVETGDGKPSVA